MIKLLDMCEELNTQIKKLKDENEKLKTEILDLTFELNYNKHTELLEFIRELYFSIEHDKEYTYKLSKEDILNNLKAYIENFAKDNKILL